MESQLTMFLSHYWLFLLLIVLVLWLVYALHLLNLPERPVLYFMNEPTEMVRSIIDNCDNLHTTYRPPWIWGRSGHLHTLIYGLMGRLRSLRTRGERLVNIMHDGATSTFDLFQPLVEHELGGDCTLLVCPGIANSSEAIYIRTFVDYAQRHGCRVAVLNHLGVLADVELTAPRIFNYGCTEEFDAMCQRMRLLYPDSRFIIVGFSMGANLVLKYLGERPSRQRHFLAAISVCQGYAAHKAMRTMRSLRHFRRCYLHILTFHVKRLLQRHAELLFTPRICKRFGLMLGVESGETVYRDAHTLLEIDEIYTRKAVGNFASLTDFYRWLSSETYLDRLALPVFLVNSLDDPLIPPELIAIGRAFAVGTPNALMAVTKHGGHLGFFEGRRFLIANDSWINKLLLQVVSAMLRAPPVAEQGSPQVTAQATRVLRRTQRNDLEDGSPVVDDVNEDILEHDCSGGVWDVDGRFRPEVSSYRGGGLLDGLTDEGVCLNEVHGDVVIVGEGEVLADGVAEVGVMEKRSLLGWASGLISKF